MIYNSLRKLPMVTYVDIIDTGDISLLTDEDTSIDELLPIWNSLYQEYQKKYNAQEDKKVFNLSKEISYLENKYIVIKYAVEALKFDVYPQLINMLVDYGYTFSEANYNYDLARVERECEGIILKIKLYKNSLPIETTETENKKSGSDLIISVMSSYSSILGYDFDFYSISVEKFHSMENQVKQKISIIEKQNSKTK